MASWQRAWRVDKKAMTEHQDDANDQSVGQNITELYSALSLMSHLQSL